jgi:hypothetical protein
MRRIEARKAREIGRMTHGRGTFVARKGTSIGPGGSEAAR